MWTQVMETQQLKVTSYNSDSLEHSSRMRILRRKFVKFANFLRILKRPTNFKIYAFLRILKQPENYNILYFIKLTSTHQRTIRYDRRVKRILVYCANSDDLGLKSHSLV